MTMYLLLMEGDDERRVEIGGGELVLGRETPSEGIHGFVLGDAEASRRHAIVRELPDGGIEVEDLASRNGTLVNGEQVRGRQRLATGDRLTIGTTIFELRSDVMAETLLSDPRGGIAETTARRVDPAPAPEPERHDTTEVGGVPPADLGLREPPPKPVVTAPSIAAVTARPAPQVPFAHRVSSARGGAIASRRQTPTLLTFSVIVATAVALVLYFAMR